MERSGLPNSDQTIAIAEIAPAAAAKFVFIATSPIKEPSPKTKIIFS